MSQPLNPSVPVESPGPARHAPAAEPVVWLTGRADGPAAGAPLGSKAGDLPDTLGWERWEPTGAADGDRLGAALAEFAERRPDTPLLIVGTNLALSATGARELARLVAAAGQACAAGPLGNADPAFDPFAGLDVEPFLRGCDDRGEDRGTTLARLVALAGCGKPLEIDTWPAPAVLLSAGAVAALADADITVRTAPSRLRDAGGRLLACDTLFVLDPTRPVGRDTGLEPHEEYRPPPWGLLTARLPAWLDDDRGLPFAPGADTLPATLHVTHSWGGGVARWVESFIEADADSRHFQLRSEGPRSGHGAGQRLALYAANRLDAPLARWWLGPAISSCSDAHAQYREILHEVIGRHGIGRIIVSSLVGHSLDALRTRVPTVQVLHDYFPRWPLLGVNPEPWLAADPEHPLRAALASHALLPDLADRDAAGWGRLSDAWHDAVSRHGIRPVAPSRSVVDLLRRLDTGWREIDIEVVHHGLPPLPAATPVTARARPDGRLRLVVPGRMTEGKGRDLLLAALPRLRKYAQLYLLGTGRDGEAFFGQAGVNVVLEYARDDLPRLLASIGPDAAALLSVVPETFSYTLSEMRQLGVPVIATRVGSLSERIRDGEDGWLIDPEPEALIDRVRALHGDRSRLDAMRGRLGSLVPWDTTAMVAKYDAMCQPVATAPAIPSPAETAVRQWAADADRAARLERENRGLRAEASALQTEVENRTDWAEERHRALLDEQERRKRWIAALESERDSVQRALDTERGNREALEQQLARILASSSWRLTRPLRGARRAASNLRQARAWNPLRWPLLLSQAVRIVATQGPGAALARLHQSAHTGQSPERVVAFDLQPIGDPEPPAELPCAGQPAASIVIPVYGKWEYTAACLRSIAAARTNAPFEVIVVDDCSRDETPRRLEGVKGLTHLRNRKNLGFVRSCNRGIEAARGRYIVLLNNDTQVLDGWLDALLATFDRFPDTGLAGAKLVYPDGRLQEAGGIVFRDGSGWNYGRGDRADRPEYAFVREVDYCSGACIALPTDLFRQLGGFDERYAPAYYEDTDLAFRVREAGYAVRLQPEATVVHHEGISSGTDVATGVKRHQQINQRTFVERWKTVLESHPEPIEDPEDEARVRRARDHRLRGRALVIDAYTPQPDQDSGSLRLCYLFDCFRRLGWGVTFFADNRGYDPEYSSALQQAGVEVLYNPWIESLQDFFRDRGRDFGLVMVSRHYVAVNYVGLVRRYCPNAKFVFDTVDLHYLREQRLAELEDSLPLKRVAAQTRRSELGVVEAADATVVVSPVEQAVLEKDAPGARVQVLSNIHRATGSRHPFGERRDLFFVGGYQHPPNIDAAQWFVGSIWPRVRERLPGATFHLIGSKAPESVRALTGDGVEFHGFVKDLDPWLDGCRLAVAPLRYGAGVKGKVNMSMSRGQPVVATPMAVEGLEATDGVDVLVAEDAAGFADAVVRLYRDEALWNRISAGGLENVRDHFSVEVAERRLAALLEALDR